MGDQSSPRRTNGAGIYDRPARRIPWSAVAGGVAVAVAALAAILWLT
jgi:hypothetical protein